MKQIFKIAMATVLVPFTLSANADTLDFEGISHSTSGHYWNMPTYAGYQWSNFGLMDQSSYINGPAQTLANANAGYKLGATSGVNEIFNLSGQDAALTKVGGGLFDFNAANMTSAWLGNHQVKVTGWLNGVVVNEKTVTLQVTGTQKNVFDFMGIDKVTFSSVAGNKIALNQFNDGKQFILDDVVLNVAPVPEPSTYAMMFAGLGVLGLMVRRRKMS